MHISAWLNFVGTTACLSCGQTYHLSLSGPRENTNTQTSTNASPPTHLWNYNPTSTCSFLASTSHYHYHLETCSRYNHHEQKRQSWGKVAVFSHSSSLRQSADRKLEICSFHETVSVQIEQKPQSLLYKKIVGWVRKLKNKIFLLFTIMSDS